jgi:hypothetical protein
MVSGMESDSTWTPEDALQSIERAAAAPWIDYPPTPWWYYPTIGAWCAALILALFGLGGLAGSAAAVALVGLEFWFIGWLKRQRGTWPRITQSPAEFKPAIRAFFAVTVVLVLVVAGVLVTAGPFAAAPLAFVGVTIGLYIYEKAYERAVASTRVRLEQAR